MTKDEVSPWKVRFKTLPDKVFVLMPVPFGVGCSECALRYRTKQCDANFTERFDCVVGKYVFKEVE